MNNKWNEASTEKQCIEVTTNGFRISEQHNEKPENWSPVSYSAIYVGCHYAVCSDDSPLPRKLSSIDSIDSSITYKYNSSSSSLYNAAYDIWLDPEPNTAGVNRTEIMIWFNRVGPMGAVGRPTSTANVGGHEWEVWTGFNGQSNVVSYLGDSAIESNTFDTMDFIRDALERKPTYGAMDWYVTSIQAGFETWKDGVGLEVSSFDVAVKGKSK